MRASEIGCLAIACVLAGCVASSTDELQARFPGAQRSFEPGALLLNGSFSVTGETLDFPQDSLYVLRGPTEFDHVTMALHGLGLGDDALGTLQVPSDRTARLSLSDSTAVVDRLAIYGNGTLVLADTTIAGRPGAHAFAEAYLPSTMPAPFHEPEETGGMELHDGVLGPFDGSLRVEGMAGESAILGGNLSVAIRPGHHEGIIATTGRLTVWAQDPLRPMGPPAWTYLPTMMAPELHVIASRTVVQVPAENLLGSRTVVSGWVSVVGAFSGYDVGCESAFIGCDAGSTIVVTDHDVPCAPHAGLGPGFISTTGSYQPLMGRGAFVPVAWQVRPTVLRLFVLDSQGGLYADLAIDANVTSTQVPLLQTLCRGGEAGAVRAYEVQATFTDGSRLCQEVPADVAAIRLDNPTAHPCLPVLPV